MHACMHAPLQLTLRPGMFSFVLKASGGAEGHLLKATESFVRAKAPNSSVPAAVYNALSDTCKGEDQRVLSRHAVLKCAFLHAGFITDTHCRAILKFDETEKKDRQPEMAMRDLRNIVHTEGVASMPQVNVFVQTADVRIVSVALKFGFYQDDAKTVNTLMYQLIEELRELTGRWMIPYGVYKNCKPKVDDSDKSNKNKDKPNKEIKNIALTLKSSLNIGVYVCTYQT